MDLIQIAGFLGYVAGAIVILTSKTKNDNIKDLSQRVKILEAERIDAREQHVANREAIAGLKGELKTYKEIPLKSIANSLEALPKLVLSNDLILGTLKKSANIAANDKNQPVITHVDEMNVDKQILKEAV